MTYLLGVIGGFVAGVALTGFLAEKRLRRYQQDAQDLIESDSKRRYGA